jgi:hypothetical protein
MTEHDEWRNAVAELTEMDWAPYEEPQTYSDLYSADGHRL